MPVKPEILKITPTMRSRLFQVEEMELRFSNGVERTYERLATRGHGAVMVVALTDKNEVVLIREFAAGLEDYLLTLPKGLIDPGENAVQAANRELKEEAGFGAEKISELKTLTTAPNYMGHQLTAVIAKDLFPCKLEGDEPEPMEVVLWPMDKLDQLLWKHDFSEARAIAALMLTRDLINQGKL